MPENIIQIDQNLLETRRRASRFLSAKSVVVPHRG